MFDTNGQLHKYNNVSEIIKSFCTVRYEHYIKRKTHQLKVMKQSIDKLNNKVRFIKEVIDRTIPIISFTQTQLVSMLKKRRYQTENGSFDYLLTIPISSMTKDRVHKLESDVKSQVTARNKLSKQTPEQLWERELQEFEKMYSKWCNEI